MLVIGRPIHAFDRVRDLPEQIAGIAELQEQLHAGEVHPAHLGQVANAADLVDILVGVQPDVRIRPHRVDEAFVLIDPQGPRVTPRKACGDRDDVDRTPTVGHLVGIKPINAIVKVLIKEAGG